MIKAVARISSGESEGDPGRALRDAQRAMAANLVPTVQALHKLNQKMLPAARITYDAQRAMAANLVPTVQALHKLNQKMLPTIRVEIAPAVLAAREFLFAAASRPEALEALQRLDDEVRSSFPTESLPASAYLNSEQLRKSTTYLVALHVLVVAAVLQAYHPSVVQAVANVLAWTGAVLMIDQILQERR